VLLNPLLLLHCSAPLEEAVLALVSLWVGLICALDAQHRLLLLLLLSDSMRHPLSCWCCCWYRVQHWQLMIVTIRNLGRAEGCVKSRAVAG
jgi:hypothetical protein